MDIFAYSDEYFEIQILDQNGLVIAIINNYTANRASFNINLYQSYTIRNLYSNKVYVSYTFSEPAEIVEYHKIDINNDTSYKFTYTNNCLYDLVFPVSDTHRFAGWYDGYGNLVIDTSGYIYDYNSQDLYARWEPLT